MKKHTIELYRQKNCWKGYGFVPWLLRDAGINVDDLIMDWANKNNAFIYKENQLERFEEYTPPKTEKHPKEDWNMILGDGIIEIELYYYDKSEVPDPKEILENYFKKDREA